MSFIASSCVWGPACLVCTRGPLIYDGFARSVIVEIRLIDYRYFPRDYP